MSVLAPATGVRNINGIDFSLAAVSHDPKASRIPSEIELISANDSTPRLSSAVAFDEKRKLKDPSNETRRQLSEVEIQILGSNSPECQHRRSASSSSHVIPDVHRLLPPSLFNQDVSKSLPQSLEDLHREHAYTSAKRSTDSNSSRRRSSDSSRRRSSDGSRHRNSSRRRLSPSSKSTETLTAIEALYNEMKYRGNGEIDNLDQELADYDSSRKDTLVSPVQSI